MSELQALIADAVKNGLANSGGKVDGSTRVLRKITDRKVEVRFVDNKVFLGYLNRGTESRPQFIYTKPDPKDPRKDIEYVDIVLEGDAKPVLGVIWRDFRKESARAFCRVIKTESKEWFINQGVVKKKEVEEYSSVELDFDVPLDVVGQVRTFTIEVPEEFGGPRTIEVNENFVNLA